LRTPVFTLLGYLETLLHSHFENAEQQQEFIGKAYQQSSRLNDLLSDLIDISRIESGEMKMAIRSIDLHAFLANQCDELQKKAEQQHIALSFANVEAKNRFGSKEIRSTSARLSPIWRKMPSSTMLKRHSGDRVSRAGEGVEVYVQDTGRGIPENHLPRIFERFYRVTKSARARSAARAWGGDCQTHHRSARWTGTGAEPGGQRLAIYFHLSRAK
jgi:two-component system phosphate regulon sensor histidine kinase PhoR